jgi:hypothetical protein
VLNVRHIIKVPFVPRVSCKFVSVYIFDGWSGLLTLFCMIKLCGTLLVLRCGKLPCAGVFENNIFVKEIFNEPKQLQWL